MDQQQEFRRIFREDAYKGARAMSATMGPTLGSFFYAEGLEKGRELGIEKGRELGIEKGRELGIETGIEQARRELLTLVLSKRFGPLSEPLTRRLAGLPAEQLLPPLERAVTAASLGELGLADASA